VHRSSESVASLAGALAKAQSELVNPEKSLIATIRTERRGEAGQSFRYAPLSSGLDIVRKTLGRHEIATIQTTAVDSSMGMINLTTMLAHASGEWIASEWPVCPLADMAVPKRMGAALTYARRYSLFTLVGIAGEDDLDAPDLDEGGERKSSLGADHCTRPARRDGHGGDGAGQSAAARTGKHIPLRARPALDPGWSAAARQQLLTEIASLDSSEEATNWVRKGLEQKNSLTSEDARIVEEAFALRVTGIGESEESKEYLSASEGIDRSQVPRRALTTIDKGALTLNEPRRYLDREHRKFVTLQPCLVCGRKPCDSHHLRFVQPRAFGRKVSDEFSVPVCRGHHRALHRSGDEAGWWEEVGIDPIKAARNLWNETRRKGARDLANSVGLSEDAKIADEIVQGLSGTSISQSVNPSSPLTQEPGSNSSGQ
jgi:hypothetical protein